MAQIISFKTRKTIPPAAVAYRQAFNDAPPANFWQIAIWCKRNQRGRLTPKEQRFIEDMTHRLVMNGIPTKCQAEWLRALYARLRTHGGVDVS